MGQYAEERGQRGVLSDANTNEFPANHDGLNEGLVAAQNPRFSFEQSSPVCPSEPDTRTNFSQSQFSSPSSSNPPGDADRSTQQYGQMKDKSSYSRTYDPPQVFASSDPNSQATRFNQAPFVQGHVTQPSTDSTSSTGSQPSRLQTSQSIVRKPLPEKPTSIQTPTSAQTPSSTDSLSQHFIDQAGFDMIATPDDVKPKRADSLFPAPQQGRDRGNSTVSSIYEDTDSTPDYASTARPSIDTQKSVERPRAGVKKTIGHAEEQAGINAPSTMITVDFGPTMNLTSDRAPQRRSPGPVQSYDTDHPPRKQSPRPAQSYSADRPARYGSPSRKSSPGPGLNYPGDRGARPESGGHSRSPSRAVIDSSESRTVAWQPGMGAVSAASGKQQGITAEQFVQQRAAAAVPLYAHQRQPSANTLNAMRNSTPTPPLVRNRSSDLLFQQGHSRNSSADLMQRPSSRGVASTFGPMGSGDITSSLSAREQEHIAKITGQPLVSVTQNNNRLSMGGGLVGAIEAREKDKQQMKAGINSQAVQHAIAQRQQQAMYQQYPEQKHRAQQSHYGNMGQYPQQYPVQSQRQQQQQYGMPQAANVFAQGGGWTVPSPQYGVPEQGQQSPLMQQYPQQQYFNQQGSQGQGGRGYR